MQEAAVVILVIAALGYLSWKLIVRINRKSDCGPDCGCEAGTLSKTK